MLNMNIVAPTSPVTANAELGRVAIASTESLALLSTLDAGVTLRSSKGLGTLKVSHQKTKELGGSTRHSVRFDLKQNGDLPPAFVNLVICGVDTSTGADRALEAFATLIGVLINETASVVTGSTPAATLASIADGENSINLLATLGKVLNGEG